MNKAHCRSWPSRLNHERLYVALRNPLSPSPRPPAAGFARRAGRRGYGCETGPCKQKPPKGPLHPCQSARSLAFPCLPLGPEPICPCSSTIYPQITIQPSTAADPWHSMFPTSLSLACTQSARCLLRIVYLHARVRLYVAFCRHQVRRYAVLWDST